MPLVSLQVKSAVDCEDMMIDVEADLCRQPAERRMVHCAKLRVRRGVVVVKTDFLNGVAGSV